MSDLIDSDDIELVDAEDEFGSPETIGLKKLVEECRKEVADRGAWFFANATLNEKMVLGEQFLTLDPSLGLAEIPWPSYVSKSQRNLMRNLSLTWASRVTEDRPWGKAWPAEPGTDVEKAYVANKYLEYLRENHDFDDMCFTAAQRVQEHSCIGFKTVWDPLSGPPSKGYPVLDEMGGITFGPDGEPQLEGVGDASGEVAWQLVTIFDYGTDGSEDIEDSEWCYFTSYVSEHTARGLCNAAGIKDLPPLETYKDIWGVERKGVLVTELWWKPGYRFPRGLYGVVVGNTAISAIPFPYDHHELPLAVWKCGARRDSAFGTSHVDDAVHIQRAINEDVSSLQQQVRQAGSVKLLANSQIIAQWDNGNQMINCDDPALINAAKFLEPPALSQSLVASRNDNIEALYNIWGLNEVLTGADSVKSGTSAKSIAYLNKLDSQKMAGASRSLNKAIIRILRQSLKLAQQYIKTERLMQIAGENNSYGAIQFIGADLAGFDVKIESASATSQMRGEIAGNAQEQIDAGNPNPQLVPQSTTGIQDNELSKATRDIVHAQAEAALGGEKQIADQQADITTAINELSTIAANVRGHPNAGFVNQLLQDYQRAQAQIAQQQQLPQQGQVPNG